MKDAQSFAFVLFLQPTGNFANISFYFKLSSYVTDSWIVWSILWFASRLRFCPVHVTLGWAECPQRFSPLHGPWDGLPASVWLQSRSLVSRRHSVWWVPLFHPLWKSPLSLLYPEHFIRQSDNSSIGQRLSWYWVKLSHQVMHIWCLKQLTQENWKYSMTMSMSFNLMHRSCISCHHCIVQSMEILPLCFCACRGTVWTSTICIKVLHWIGGEDSE